MVWQLDVRFWNALKVYPWFSLGKTSILGAIYDYLKTRFSYFYRLYISVKSSVELWTAIAILSRYTQTLLFKRHYYDNQ